MDSVQKDSHARVIVKDLRAEPNTCDSFFEELSRAVSSIFESFGGSSLLKASGNVYLKPNAIDSKPYAYTRPELVQAVIEYFKGQGARRIYVMENSTQSNYTRIVFDAIGYTKICRKTGAVPVYLDEQKTKAVEFHPPSSTPSTSKIDYDQNTFEIPLFIAENLIARRSENLYVNLPKLKMHSMGVVTLGIKNQWAFPAHYYRKFDHNYNLHSKLVDVLQLIEPDFTLIEGVEGVVHGHYPVQKFHDRVIKPFRVLIGSPNVLAADMVGARVFGLSPDEVPAIKLVKERQLCGGVQNFDDLQIEGDLSRFTEKFDFDIIQEFPPNVQLVKGHTLLCREGCLNNPLMLAQVLYYDYGGTGLCQLVMGKGHDLHIIDQLPGPVVVAGHCAIEEVGDRLNKRLGRSHVVFSDGCNNLRQSAVGLGRFMGVNLLRLIPQNPIKGLYLLLQAKLHGSTANVPGVWEILKPYKVRRN